MAVVVVTYFVQQRQITARNKNNPTINDNPAAAQQQMIMKIFPIFSGVFAFIVPAALAWYFLVQNLFRIGQQAYITKRFYKEHPDAIAARQAGSTAKPAQNAKGRQACPGQGSLGQERRRRTSRPRGRLAKAIPPKAGPRPTRPAPSRRRRQQQREAPRGPEASAAPDWEHAEASGSAAAPAEEEALSPNAARNIPMEWVETTGRTTEEAKDHALDQLGVDESDAEFEILEEPRPGLFGRVRGEARVAGPGPPDRPASEGRAAGIGAASATTPLRRARTAMRPRRRRRTVRPPEGEDAPRRPARPTAATQPNEEITMNDGEHSIEDVEAGATAFLDGLLDAFGLQATVTASQPADGEIEVAIEGEGLGLLVGPKGQTLLAIQDLTRLVAQRHVGPGSPRLGVDVGGYRQRRVEALQRFSRQVAEQVLESGQSKALEPMAAADRKVVHDALTDVAGVSTMSEGEEPYRRVVIVAEASRLTRSSSVEHARWCAGLTRRRVPAGSRSHPFRAMDGPEPDARDAGLRDVLREAQRQGFLGARAIDDVIAHSEGFLPPIEGAGRVLDLGSGGGVPGLVVASRLDTAQVVLLDASERRTDWLRRAVARLGWERSRAGGHGSSRGSSAHDPAWRQSRTPSWPAASPRPMVTAECAGRLPAGRRLAGRQRAARPADRPLAQRRRSTGWGFAPAHRRGPASPSSSRNAPRPADVPTTSGGAGTHVVTFHVEHRAASRPMPAFHVEHPESR